MKGYEHLGPGLHRIGPNPWDFVFNTEAGQRLSVVGMDGVLYTETVKSVDEDEDTGDLTIELY